MPSDRPNRSHGTFTPATTVSRILGRAGHKPFQARTASAFGGHRCSWNMAQGATRVTHWPGDDTPDEDRDAERTEMIGAYERVLTANGYRVERKGNALTVWPKEQSAKPAPAKEAPATASAKLTPTQERALALMRANHGNLISGKGIQLATMRILERAGLVTMTTWTGSTGGMLGRGNNSTQFDADLTDAGWGEHERTTAPKYPHGAPTPVEDLQPGDVVINVYDGTEGTWRGRLARNGQGPYWVDIGYSMPTDEGCWRFVSRPEPAPAAEAAQEPLSVPAVPEEPDVPLDQDKPVPYASSPSGVRYEPGMRVTNRTSDGFWAHGVVEEVYLAAHTRTPHLRFTVDAYQVAPRRRAPKYMDNKPGKRGPAPAHMRPLTVALDDKDLSPEIVR